MVIVKSRHKPRQRKAARGAIAPLAPSVANLRPNRNPRVYPLSMPRPDKKEKDEREKSESGKDLG